MAKPVSPLRNRDNPEIGTGQASDDKIAFGARFVFAANALGENDSEISRLSGVPKSTISRCRNAESFPDARYVFRLAETLRVDPRWFITGEGSPGVEIDTAFSDPDAERELLWHFRCIPDHHQPAILTIAQALAEASALDLGSSRSSARKTLQAQSQKGTVHTPSDDYRAGPKR